MLKIKQLHPDVVRKIAAGEVIERPGSIVKEMLENSADAGATSILVEIKSGGIDYIKVSDDGIGMSAIDLAEATKLHSTSKLEKIDDLYTINSLGFRGEALASIAAVCDLEIITSEDGESAHRWDENNGVTAASRDKGSTFIVENIFRNIPARRKFLKSIKTEESFVRQVVKLFSLSFPEIALKFISDSRVIYDLGIQSISDRFEQLYKLSSHDTIPFENSNNRISVSGLLTKPAFATKKQQVCVIVNSRVVKSPLIVAAVKQAYADKIPKDMQPQFLLRLSLSGSEIDVNIHPRKEEVKFSDESEIFKFVLHTCADKLSSALRSEFNMQFTNIVKKGGGKGTSKNYSKPTVYDALRFSQELLRDEPSNTLADRNLNLSDESKPYNNYLDSRSSNEVTKYSQLNAVQLLKTYIFIESNNNVLVIDQHAADERVNFEKIKKQLLSGQVESVPLLLTQQIEFRGTEGESIETLEKVISGMNRLGFVIRDFGVINGVQQLSIETVPLLLANKISLEEIFTKIVTDLTQEGVDFADIEHKLDLVCATIACHGSIRSGDSLSQQEIGKLLEDLWSCNDPYTCPHGRPIVWELTKQELEKKFLRRK